MAESYHVGEVTESVIILHRGPFHDVALAVRTIEAVHDRAGGYHLVTTSGQIYHVRRSSKHDQLFRQVLGLSS